MNRGDTSGISKSRIMDELHKNPLFRFLADDQLEQLLRSTRTLDVLYRIIEK